MATIFQHSVKVPRLYKVAANIAKQFNEGVGSIKQLVYGEKKKHPNVQAIYSLVTTLFQKSNEIEILLKRSQIIERESRCEPWLIKILIVELLWGKKGLPGQSKPENTVRGYEQIFKGHLTDISYNEKTEESPKPRYVRVNTLFLETEQAIQNFECEGWVLTKIEDKNDYDGYLQKISTLQEGEFMVDLHIPDLLVFPRKTKFHNHRAYLKVSILLQDKASCLPVHILAPPPGSVVLDMCAAPGMKTSHLAAIMKDEGIVYAVEKDLKRFEYLKNTITDVGTVCVEAINKDVLDCSAKDFPGVEYILVDPSCSGTRMTQRYYSSEKIEPERLQKLAGFQIKILRTALTKYPDAKRVVYSTCSILQEENEDVVRQVLETNFCFKLVPAKQFVSGPWKNFGSTSDYGELGAYCLYARPEEDLTNGFFVAVFERLVEGEQNKFFNNKIYSFKRNIDKKERKLAKKLEREQRLNEDFEPVDISNAENIDQESGLSSVKDSVDTNMTKDNHSEENMDETQKKAKKRKKKRKQLKNENGIPNESPEKKLNEEPVDISNAENIDQEFGLSTSKEYDEETQTKNKKHKKKRKHAENEKKIPIDSQETVQIKSDSENLNTNAEHYRKKSKKKERSVDENTERNENITKEVGCEKNSKKSKKKLQYLESEKNIFDATEIVCESAEQVDKKKKKRRHKPEDNEEFENDAWKSGNPEGKRKTHTNICDIELYKDNISLTEKEKSVSEEFPVKTKKKKVKDKETLQKSVRQ